MKWRRLLRALESALCLEVVAFALPPPASSFGCEGHQIVALIAEKHLSVHARREVSALLDSPDANGRAEERPSRGNRGRGCKADPLDAFVRASVWADEVRASRPETASWHFLDIPLGTQDARQVEDFCGESGCVTRAIRAQTAILREEGAPPAQRAEALRFVIHFVGDVHQPLHCATNNDRGGNCVPVEFFGRPSRRNSRSSQEYEPNLHTLWDSSILRRTRGRRRVATYANDLERRFHTQIEQWLQADFAPDAWAWESFELAGSEAYGRLPAPIPVEKPEPIASCRDASQVGARMAALHEAVGERYRAAAAAVIDEQLAKAGARLALVLNRLWP